MEKENRKAIAEYSRQIDDLEMTKDLISTSDILCFTAMDRGPEKTVSIELVEKPNTQKEMVMNGTIKAAKDGVIKYIDEKIRLLNEKIDKIVGGGV